MWIYNKEKNSNKVNDNYDMHHMWSQTFYWTFCMNKIYSFRKIRMFYLHHYPRSLLLYLMHKTSLHLIKRLCGLYANRLFILFWYISSHWKFLSQRFAKIRITCFAFWNFNKRIGIYWYNLTLDLGDLRYSSYFM